MGLLNDDKAIFSLVLNDRVKGLLLNMARWTKFLAIFGFVLMGIMVIFMFIGIFAAAGGGMTAGNPQSVYVVIAAIVVVAAYFYPTYTLLMYSSRIKKAFASHNQDHFEQSINYLKNTFKYIAIMMIISLVLYGVAFIFIALAALKSGL